MHFSNLRRAAIATLTTAATAISIQIATLPNPTQPQKDLGNTMNKLVLMGSQFLLEDLKRKDQQPHKK